MESQPHESNALVLAQPAEGKQPQEQEQESLTQTELEKQEEEKAMKEASDAFGMVYNVKKPASAVDGVTSGLGNVLKGGLAGVAAVGAMTAVGAKEQGAKGALKGFGAGLVAGVGLAAAGVGTGVYQIGRGVANTP